MIIITNRVLEKATGFTHTQIKRWAVAFLQPDKTSGQHAGVSRTYNFEQSMRIYLGGYLVRDLKFTLTEARQILNDLSKWLEKKGWTVSEWVKFRESKLNRGCVANCEYPFLNLSIDIGVGSDGTFFYNAKIIFKQELIKEPNKYRDEYDLEYFGRRSAISVAPFRSIDIKAIVNGLAILIAQSLSE